MKHENREEAFRYFNDMLLRSSAPEARKLAEEKVYELLCSKKEVA